MSIGSWLEHPLTRGLDIDDPRTISLRRQIVREKAFLRRLYEEWYGAIAASLPSATGPVLELGSGAGFLADFVPDLIPSEIFPVPGVAAVLDAADLPFRSRSLRAAAMTNVLHHVPNPRRMLEELARCIRSGGVVSMIEPWVSPWSRFIYRRLHHELFDPDAREWEWSSSGPLTGANSAQAWILFQRDRTRFERELPQWSIRSVKPLMPLRYLVSGGITYRALAPTWTFRSWRRLEGMLAPYGNQLAMFAHIVLGRT